MKAILNSNIILELNDEVKIELKPRDAFALYLYTTRWGWSQTKLSMLNLELATPITLRSELNEVPPCEVKRVFVYGHWENKRMIFTLSGSINVLIDCGSLRQILEKIMISFYGEAVRMPNLLGTDDHVQDEDHEVSNGYFVQGKEVFLRVQRGYVGFVTKVHGEHYDLCDTNLFMDNKNLPRSERVEKLGFVNSCYTGGYRSKEILANMHIAMGAKQPAMEITK